MDAGICGNGFTGQVGETDDAGAVFLLDDLAGPGALDIAALRHREVEDHAAGFHAGDLRVGDQARRSAAGDQCGGDDDILLGDVTSHQRIRLISNRLHVAKTSVQIWNFCNTFMKSVPLVFDHKA